MYNKVKDIIKNKKNDIDDNTLTYFTNYFYVLVEKNIIPQEVKLEDLIDNALVFASKIEFYGKDHWVYKKNGGDTKGLRDPESKTIFIRDDLQEPLKEMVIYHELHHAVQTNIINNEVGINQESNIGRMIMEAQTQWFAEEVYKIIHNVDYDTKEIPTENLRMQLGGTIVSKLHNYEMYDAMLSKLAIILEVPKEFFVSINFLYKDNKGLKLLEKKYNQVYETRKLKYTFNGMMYIYDYIYCVDLQGYVENPDKQVILSGRETENSYSIYPNRGNKLSLKLQKIYIDDFDVSTFLALLNNGGDYKSFANYVVDNNKREILNQYINPINKEEISTPKSK